jgi:hypothetical protein
MFALQELGYMETARQTDRQIASAVPFKLLTKIHNKHTKQSDTDRETAL